jgi:threonine/homoserine/homoserine lactone efflux protein
MIGQGVLVSVLYVMAAGGLRRVWVGWPGLARGGRYLSGSVYLGLGLATALAGPARR